MRAVWLNVVISQTTRNAQRLSACKNILMIGLPLRAIGRMRSSA